MKPILFSKTATAFTTNGLGRLDAISCIVTEERNGMFELEMEVAEAAAHASEIEMSSIIVVKVPDKTNLQAFRVYRLTKPLNGIFKIFAQHISYQLSYIPCMPFSVDASSSACNLALQGLKTNAVESCPFTFSTDVTTVASYKQTTPASIKSRLGGVEGSVLDQFRGEYEWDNYTVYFKKNRGLTVPVVTLNYGKNITDINQEENIENTVTGIVPYWVSVEGDTVVTLPEKSVDSQYASAYPFKRTIPYDFSQSFEEAPTVLELRTKAQAYVNQTGLGIPDVSIKLSFVALADTEEYKDIAALQTVKLCDTIQVYFEKLGISTTAKVVKYEYDVLTERYNSIEVGTIRRTLATTISGNMEEIEGVGDLTKDMIQKSTATLEGDIGDALDDAKDYADGVAGTAETNAKNFATNAANTAQANAKTYTDTQVATRTTAQQVATAINNATAWLTGSDGYVMAVKNNDGTWKELIFADHNDPTDWVNVLRINENGIGFSSDGGVHYTQAWTLDGKLVIGGTDVPSLTVYDNQNPPNIIFQTSRAGTIWNSTNSSMTAAGLLTAVGATLQNATITSTNQAGAGLNINANELTFKYNNSAIATISANNWSNNTYLDINSDYRINLVSDQAAWSGNFYSSKVYIGDQEMTMFTGDEGAVADFDIEWSDYEQNFTLGDQYENLGVDYDGYGAAWLTYDQMWFEAGTDITAISAVAITNVKRFSAWGYRT